MHTDRYMTQGFTLVELLVVTGMIAILSAMLLSGITNARDTAQVRAVARQVASSLRTAENYALSGRIVDQQKVPCEYRFVTTTTQMKIQYTHHAPGATTCSAPEDVATYGTGTATVTPATVRFAVPYGTADVTTSITVIARDAQQRVCIDGVGRVRENC